MTVFGDRTNVINGDVDGQHLGADSVLNINGKNAGGKEPVGRGELLRLFTQFRGDLVRFLTRRTGNAAMAADLSHDVYEKLCKAEPTIPTPQMARSYIFKVASNLAIDQLRVDSRRAEILDGSQILFEDVDYSPEDIAISRDQLKQVEKALAELPPKVSEVLVLARVYGLRHKEIAAKLNISVSLVEKYQLRALMYCRDRLEADF